MVLYNPSWFAEHRQNGKLSAIAGAKSSSRNSANKLLLVANLKKWNSSGIDCPSRHVSNPCRDVQSVSRKADGPLAINCRSAQRELQMVTHAGRQKCLKHVRCCFLGLFRTRPSARSCLSHCGDSGEVFRSALRCLPTANSAESYSFRWSVGQILRQGERSSKKLA